MYGTRDNVRGTVSPRAVSRHGTVSRGIAVSRAKGGLLTDGVVSCGPQSHTIFRPVGSRPAPSLPFLVQGYPFETLTHLPAPGGRTMALTKRKRIGAVYYRNERGQLLNAWRKHSPFNPYWLDWSKLRQSVEGLSVHAKGMLLDVGVSEGPYRSLFEPLVERYVGVEYPPSILDKQPDLWNILDRAKKSIDVFGDGYALPFAADSFDTVLCTEVLEHVASPGKMVKEMASVLKPGGLLLCTVPFSQPLHELPNDYYRFTPSALEKLSEAAGLEVVSITPRGNFASAMSASLAQFSLRWLGASKRQSDGSVIICRWRSLLLLPLFAVTQVTFSWISKMTSDTAVCQGYSLIAKRPE